jgi:biopolymer transport protein ExbD
MPLKRKSEAVIGEFAIIGLVDVIMTILIFVMATSGGTAEQKVLEFSSANHQTPVGQGTAEAAQTGLTVTIDSNGNYLIGEQSYTSAQLKTYLASKLQSNSKLKVIAGADGRSPIEAFTKLHMICKKVGIEEVQLPLRESESGEEVDS